MIEPMHLQKGDIEFIQANYPEVYQMLKSGLSTDKLTVTLKSEEQWDTIWNTIVDWISGSLDESGDNLNDNGLRLERILDFA